MRRRMPALLAACVVTLGGGSACGGSTPSTQTPADGPIQVQASDAECKVARTEVPAGVTVFTVTNQGSKVTEFYVYAAGDRVMGEIENIGPGLSREFRVELPAGTYETACKPGMSGKGIRGAFKVTGDSKPLTEDAKLAAAAENYQRYVKSQTDALITKTKEFVDAVKAGDIEK